MVTEPSGIGQREFNGLLLVFVVIQIVAVVIQFRRHRAFGDLDALERRFTGSVGPYCVRIPVTWRTGLRIRRYGVMLVDETEVVLASSKSIKRWPIWHSGTMQIPRPVAARHFWLRGLYDDRSSLVIASSSYIAEAEVAMEKLGWRVTGWRNSTPESANDE